MKIGILGGGQLARMLALGGHPLGLSFVILDPAPDACAAAVAEHIVGNYDDAEKLKQLAARSDAITYEFENVPAESVKYLSEMKVPVYPPTEALAVSRDRLKEKTLFRELGIPVPDFYAINSLQELKDAAAKMNFCGVLKTRTMGYDGKGQAVIKSESDVESAWDRVGANGAECILESFVNFSREISIVAVRGKDGEIIYYPVGENTHRDGILRVSICKVNDSMQKLAQDYVHRILKHFDYVGVIALELFEANGVLMANEIAPRVHNTGHWTIEGAHTSQFENHIRAVAGLPLGDTSVMGHCGMVNFIGELPDIKSVLKIDGAHYHGYCKEVKSGRKVGHATVHGSCEKKVLESLDKIKNLCDIA